ncbi:MAG: amino acid ABC transporter ATP-binding protein, partial [Mesorhizobium sp.]
QEVVDVLSQLAREGTTMVMATHDLRLASKIAQEVVFLDAGAIVEKGPAAVLFSNPERQRTRRFIATLKQEAEKEGGGEG